MDSNNITNISPSSNIIVAIKPSSYYSTFRNTPNLPITSIINTIEEEYPSYLSNPENKNLSLSDIFDTSKFKFYLQSTKGNYNGINIKNKNTFPLEKLISYLIYTKSSYLLVKTDGDSETDTNNIYTFSIFVQLI
jgi:hypothetical protein